MFVFGLGAALVAVGGLVCGGRMLCGGNGRKRGERIG